MFITYKQNDSNPHVLGTTNNIIDALFENVPYIDYKDKKIVQRYKTKYVTDQILKTEAEKKLKMFYLNAKDLIDRCKDRSYIHFEIPKKTKGTRPIDAPNVELKHHMSLLARMFEYTLDMHPHDSAWAYVKSRDVVGAMHEHTNHQSKWFLKLDLHNFFGSCTKDFIKQQLVQLYPICYSTESQLKVLEEIIEFCLLNGSLPQGTPMSPILTNLIMIPIDFRINKLLASYSKKEYLLPQRYVYTRYADDMIISSRSKVDYNTLIHIVKETLVDTPLQLNESKTRYASNAGRNWNLGIMCNSNNDTTVGYRRKHDVKLLIFNYIKDKETYTLNDLRYLLGQLSWINNVEPDYFKGFLTYVNKKYNINLMKDINSRIKSLS